ncbi:uncharacterized protein F4812DRAFT_401917 [Daldinia caldariorum]|uniref:uncharacterized protein n=1 Tax=Daldinia caldariorum TaxID=326644 RepID=UPI002007AA36|nr:uncharacterized protein F4812DRAFT_401917 [Daldinia caldariorum]KAI1467594.1 hypothetical protein F4812DRAFT_401917 [Daldinia caldariorum]
MHGKRSGSAALLAILSPLLLSFPGSCLAAKPAKGGLATYIVNSAEQFSARSLCGYRESLISCFSNAPEYADVEYLEECFTNAGCNKQESKSSAREIAESYYKGLSAPELRRRRPDPTPAPTPAPDEAVTTSTNAVVGFQPSIECSSVTVVPTSVCPIQSTGTASGKTLPCFDTQATATVCKAENLCSTDKDGNHLCMLRKDSLDTGEIVMTIILATVFGLGFATLLFFCVRDKADQRKRRARAEAAAIAKTAAVNKTPNPFASSAAVDEHSAILPKREPSAASGGHNPFVDAPYDAPPAQNQAHY